MYQINDSFAYLKGNHLICKLLNFGLQIKSCYEGWLKAPKCRFAFQVLPTSGGFQPDLYQCLKMSYEEYNSIKYTNSGIKNPILMLIIFKYFLNK